jgi:cell division protein FtsB
VKGILVIPVLLGLALLQVAFDDDAGIRQWLHLRGELEDAHGRIEALRAEVDDLEREADVLDVRGFALERAIREELELVRPGQTLVRLGGGGVSSARIP